MRTTTAMLNMMNWILSTWSVLWINTGMPVPKIPYKEEAHGLIPSTTRVVIVTSSAALAMYSPLSAGVTSIILKVCRVSSSLSSYRPPCVIGVPSLNHTTGRSGSLTSTCSTAVPPPLEIVRWGNPFVNERRDDLRFAAKHKFTVTYTAELKVQRKYLKKWDIW